LLSSISVKTFMLSLPGITTVTNHFARKSRNTAPRPSY
jgi:hypothetical protein